MKYNKEQRLDIGRRIYDGEINCYLAAEEYSINHYTAKDMLLEMKKEKDKATENGKDSLSYYHCHKFNKKYDELIEQARKENPLPETT